MRTVNGTATRGEVIRKARETAGLTQDQVAAGVEVTQATISRIESGEITPTVATLTRLIEFLGINPADVL